MFGNSGALSRSPTVRPLSRIDHAKDYENFTAYDISMIFQTMRWAVHVLFWIALVLVPIGLFKRNSGYAKLCGNGNVRFLPRWWFVSAWIYILVRFAFFGSNYLRTGFQFSLQFLTGAMISIAAIGGMLSLPGVLMVTNDALEERNWIWRNKKIRWSEVQEIHAEKKGSAITVIGPGRSRILYTNVYPDRARFLIEIKKHCGDNLPPDFPSEPLNSDTSIR